jgi:hypothetical protein
MLGIACESLKDPDSSPESSRRSLSVVVKKSFDLGGPNVRSHSALKKKKVVLQ